MLFRDAGLIQASEIPSLIEDVKSDETLFPEERTSRLRVLELGTGCGIVSYCISDPFIEHSLANGPVVWNRHCPGR